MTTMRISDQDIERLVQGNGPENEELARLGEALQSWQADFTRTPTDEQVAAFASQAAVIARQTRPEPTPKATRAPSKNRFRALKAKLATAMAAVLIVSGMTGVAVASDGAAPGDALYGLDRALESVGINNGGAAERIEEAQALLDAGLVGEAVEHTAEAFEDDETATEVVNALLNAADRVRTNAGNRNATDTANSVADMLETLAAAEKGPGFGQMVSEMARNINGTTPEKTGQPPELPDQSNGDPPQNNSENSGEPERGNQGNQGNQGNRGNQGNQGPPDEPPGQSGKNKAQTKQP